MKTKNLFTTQVNVSDLINRHSEFNGLLAFKFNILVRGPGPLDHDSPASKNERTNTVKNDLFLMILYIK